MKTVTVLVACFSAAWIKVAMNSYRRFFSDTLVVVDNNPQPGEREWNTFCDAEQQWLRSQSHIHTITNQGSRTHGGGLDAAVAWCRQNDVEIMVHIEPDCLISGPQWRRNLVNAVEQGAWMAGAVRKRYGPTHVTPSAWLVDELNSSFEAQPRGADRNHPRFDDLVDWQRLLSIANAEGSSAWFETMWDTG